MENLKQINPKDIYHQIINNFTTMIENLINELMNPNKTYCIISIYISLFTVSYITLARPKLPSFIIKLLENFIVRIILISYILYTSTYNLQVSVIVTICFLLLLQMSNKQKINEMFESSKPNNTALEIV